MRFIKQNEKRRILSNLYLTIINPYFPNEKKKNLSHKKKRKTPTEEDRNDTSAKTAYFQSHGKKRERETDTERERRNRRRGENCNKGMTLITVKYVSQ